LEPAGAAGSIDESGGSLRLRFTPQRKAFANYDAEVRGGDVAHFITSAQT
jgi:hypothetical protein